MHRIFRLSVLALAVGAAACTPEAVVETEDIPTAGVRFINAVPDTIGFDFKPVDIVENSVFYGPGPGGVTFRATGNIFYKNARAGQRNFRIFLSPPNHGAPAAEQFAIATTVVEDINVTLEAGKRYTFILWGNMRPGSTPGKQLTILEDDPADPGSQVALRVINAAVGLSPLDVRHYPDGGTVPGAPVWANVAPMTTTGYVTTTPGAIRFNVQPAGGGAALFADALAPAGVAENIDTQAIPGSTIPGTALSAIIFPRSVAGSTAPQTFTTPGIFIVWDRRPPTTCALC